MKKLKICLAWHNLHSSNYGVSALAIAHLNLLTEVAEENGLALEIETLGTLSSNNLDIQSGIEDRLGINVVHKEFGLRSVAKNIVTFHWGKINVFKNAQYDYVFDIGEGDSFTDIYGLKRFFIFSLSKWLVVRVKIPLIISPQTIGPFKHRLASKIASYLVKRSKVIYVRDHKSSDYLKEQGIKHEEISDVAFLLPFDSMPKIEDSVGVNISALLWHGGYTKNNQFELGVDYQKLVVDIIYGFIKRGKLVYLISHVITDTIEVEDDYRISQLVKNNFFDSDNAVLVAPKFGSPIEAKSYLSQMQFFLGSRMHATIGALSSGVPTIPLAYSRKFSGVFESINYPYTIDIYGEQDSNMVLIKIFEYYDNQFESIISQTEESISIAKQRLTAYSDFLKGLLK